MSTGKYGTPQRIDSCLYTMLTDHDIRTKAIALLSFVVNIRIFKNIKINMPHTMCASMMLITSDIYAIYPISNDCLKPTL